MSEQNVAHTPTPWEIEEGHIQRDSGGIRYWQITDGQDAIACNQFCYAGYDPETNKANAALIVRAVNSHDELVAELARVTAELYEFASIQVNGEHDKRLLRIVSRARAALSRARGEGE